jgi:peptidyl-tRNA hydrolase
VLITRRDLSPGYQSVQPAHALAQFSQTYPEQFADWYKNGQNLIVLAATNETHLLKLAEVFTRDGILHTVFREPDIKNKITAIAVEPHVEAYKVTSSLPLALKDHVKYKPPTFWEMLGFSKR